MNDLVLLEYCDFPLCSRNCWTRCDINAPCWDGRPAHWYREVWKAIQRRGIQPRQDDLFGERAA